MEFVLLQIDLKAKRAERLKVPEQLLKDFIGGRGLGVRLFFDFADKEYFTAPVIVNAPVFFLTGPLTGSIAPLSGRFHAVFHSPLTGTICDSSCGGRAGVYLKSNGIDGIVIKGVSETPVYVVIENGEVLFGDASSLTDKNVSEKELFLKNSLKGDISSIIVGPAGEKGVLFANAVSDRRFFGRGGLGYLLGAKNLLAVAVKKGGNKPKEPLYREQFNFVVEEIKKWLHGNPITSQGLPEFGTSVLMNLINERGLLPHKNFKESHFEAADAISGEALKEKVIKRRACFSCMVGCGRVTGKGEGPEFETLWSLGANLGVKDLDFVIELNNFCFEQGMDTISLGGSLAAYFEIKGFEFGDTQTIKRLVNATAKREGEGKLIAQGSKRLCEELNRKEVSMSVKGMELPAYHPAKLSGMALAYGTSNRGGCHLRSYMIAPEVLGIPRLIDPRIKSGKAGLVIYYQNSHAVADCAIFCRFLSLAVSDEYLSRLLSAYTGFDMSTVDYHKIGERVYVLERLFNIKMGFNENHDLLPERLAFDGYDQMLKEYYNARGYDEKGVPKAEKLKSLGLDMEFCSDRRV